ncbi:MAG: purine-nucleoside phosphorylase, partial [Hyphomicrobiales bacterium]
MAADPAFDQVASILADRGVDAIDCAIVLGTGLGAVAEDIQDAIRIPYADLPGFPRGEVSGHARQLCYGTLHGRKVLIYQGRAHYYEGGDSAVMRVPLGVLAALVIMGATLVDQH